MRIEKYNVVFQRKNMIFLMNRFIFGTNILNKMNILKRIQSYIKFYIKSKPAIGHGIHSPFVYQFSTEILLKGNKKIKKLNQIELLRKNMTKNRSIIEVSDFGAGNSSGTKLRKIADIAKKASSPRKYCNLLFRITEQFKPESIIELGTSLGLASASMALASADAKLITIEGCPAIAGLAKENFELLGIKNIQQHVGQFDEILPTILPKLNHPFIAFIDGNHKYEPTLKYFKQILSICNCQSIIIIDDIHWSEEMEQAWNEIKAMPETIICIDLYRMGIIFFRTGLPKQEFIIQY